MSLFAHSLTRALADLVGFQVGVGGTLGTMRLMAAGLLCLATSLHRTAWGGVAPGA